MDITKPIRISNHAQIQCNERGVSIDEVEESILNGSIEPAKKIAFKVN